MNRKFKLTAILLTIFFIIVIADLGWTLYVNNGRLISLQFLRSSDKADSKQREMFIDEDLKIVAVGDSIDPGNLEVWRDKFLVVHQIGISPIHYTTENTSKTVVNVRPTQWKHGWLVSFNGDSTLYGFLSGQSYVTYRSDTAIFNFYYNSAGNIRPIGQLKIIPVDK